MKNERFRLEFGGLLVLSAFLLAATWWEWLPLDLTEALGFVTGALCVWLVTRGNIWNWPIGIANNVFFAILFWKARLFADMGLQAVYFVLAIWGWWNWLHGGKNEGELQVDRTPKREWLPLAYLWWWGLWVCEKFCWWLMARRRFHLGILWRCLRRAHGMSARAG